jgi:hypothetical protein
MHFRTRVQSRTKRIKQIEISDDGGISLKVFFEEEEFKCIGEDSNKNATAFVTISGPIEKLSIINEINVLN